MQDSVIIRVVSNVQREWVVPTPVRKHFLLPGGGEVRQHMSYRSKAIMLFQNFDGIDICLFCMYVHEYNGSAPAPNKKQVYISYLDSVEYFRPRAARTAVYHEILMAYLAWARKRGFTTAHLWACPPQRGNNFIFWCHPQHQRTPSKDRLLTWYKAMLKKSLEQGIVTRVNNFSESYFQGGINGYAIPCPPLFEGDYWIDEAVRLFGIRQRRKVTLSDNASAMQQCQAFLRTLRLHPSAHAFNTPVDPVALMIPDYLTVIKQPMDLSTVANKLRTGQYHMVKDMIADVRLVFSNAKKYNPPKHPVHVAACTLKAVAEREWEAMRSRWTVAHQPQGKEAQLAAAAVAAIDPPLREPGGVGALGVSVGALVAGAGTSALALFGGGTAAAAGVLGVGSASGLPLSDASSSGGPTGSKEPSDMSTALLSLTDESGEGAQNGSANSSSANTSSLSAIPAAPLSAPSPPKRLRSVSMDGSVSDGGDSYTSDEVLLIHDGDSDGGSVNGDLGVEVDEAWANGSSGGDSQSHGEPHELGDGSASSSGGGSGGAATDAVSGSVDPLGPSGRYGLKQNWLIRDVSKSVLKLKEDLLVLHLRPESSSSTEERARGIEAWAQYTTGSLPLVDDASDPDGRSEISRPLVDGRHTMLEMSMFRHIQFDSLRRAKHATSLLLYHLHFPERSLDAYCSTCAARLVGLRWHCATCTNFDVCSDCALTPGKKSVHNHPLTPYHVSDIYYEADDT